MSNFWKHKLAAYLHDPPEKGYNYGPRHKERAEQYKNQILGAGAWQGHEPDWAAAAADRFVFPDGKKLSQLEDGGLGGGVSFVHPLSGAPAGLSFPAEEDAGNWISSVFPDFGGGDPATQYWLLWRAWLHFCVTHASGQNVGAETLAYLPADTRVPDSTIWHHNAIVSALEATRGADQKLHPAFLLFQIGPVQEFIAQARSTRDLWSGSYLLSWMIAHALKVVADQLGPDNIIYPSLRGQPLYDWLNQTRLQAATYGGQNPRSFWDSLGLAHSQDLVLTPNLPNRFLALVPADFDVTQIEIAFESEWDSIANHCWQYLDSRCPLGPDKNAIWQFQVGHFWQITWQLWPWQNLDEALAAVSRLAIPTGQQLAVGKRIAEAIPASHKDTRNYPLNSGWGWSAHYQLANHALDARRHTRDFSAWQGRAGAPKDYLSGKEEVIADKQWLERARSHDELKHLFRKDDELGAINVIKRAWHRAYLEKEKNLKRARVSFDSVPAVAAAPWVDQIRQRLQEPDLWADFIALTGKLSDCAAILEPTIPSCKASEKNWLNDVDAEIFHANFWRKLDEDVAGRPEIKTAAAALAEFKSKHRLGESSKYVAVLTLDGDGIGQWLSGVKMPKIAQVITAKAAQYFRKHVPDSAVWLNSGRPLSPSYHLQFSEALANFGLYCAQRIVEAHHGQLIYAGGDDVLAMLPATEALKCAAALRLAFQGSPELPARLSDLFVAAPLGFVKLHSNSRRQAEPSWPLLVPGPTADLSAGIAIGHMHAPLQNLVEAARQAEKRAKQEYGKSAFAISLFKRSGETIQWGAKWDTAAIKLAEEFTTLAEDETLSGRFPYALAELLRKYDTPIQKNGKLEPFRIEATPDFDAIAVIRKDLEHVTRQQGKNVPPSFVEIANQYLEQCRGHRLDDFLGPFLTTTFINRGGGE